VDPGSAIDPAVVGEQILTAGKGRHQHVVGFQLDFNQALDASAAQDPANYNVDRRVNHGHPLVSRQVAFRAVYTPGTRSVQLLLTHRPRFAHGGRIVVDPNSTTSLARVATTSLVISPGARSMVVMGTTGA
jgi:hypothetical protein